MLIIDCIYDIVFRRMDVEASNAAPTQTLRSDRCSGSFTRAAEELFLTQPTVSQQIKQLTKAVGLPLFEQVGKRLTSRMQVRVLRCAKIFPRLSQLEMTLADLKGLKFSLRLSDHNR